MSTNFEKLVRWDADFYKATSDSECLLCLTEQEVYLIGQIIDSIRWFNTRWIGDKTGLNFGDIADNLEAKLSERMTCEKTSSIFETINQLQLDISRLQNTLNNYVDAAPDVPYPDANTPIQDAEGASLADLSGIGTDIDGCDTDDKDALYGAVNQVVRYIVQQNADFLENMTQTQGNIAEQFQTLLGAFPPTDLAAADDAAKLIAFYTNELLEEYNATVDEELIQTTVCDIFCIAVSNDCNTNMYDISNYFGGKVDTTFLNFGITLSEMIQYALTGTFTGDQYFYYLCYFQLASAALAKGMGIDSLLKGYELQIAAGQNSPDNDWTLFCTECPQYYRIVEFDFTRGQFDTYQDEAAVGLAGLWGVYVAGMGWELEDSGSGYTAKIALALDPTWEVLSVGWHLSGNVASRAATLRPTAGSVTGAQNIGFDTACADYNNPSVSQTGSDGWNEIAVRFNAGETTYIEKMAIIYTVDNRPIEAVATTDSDVCP